MAAPMQSKAIASSKKSVKETTPKWWKVLHVDTNRDLALKLIPARFVNLWSSSTTTLSSCSTSAPFIWMRRSSSTSSAKRTGSSISRSNWLKASGSSEWIELDKRLGPENTLDLAESVATALKHAWTEGALMHGDLSTRNIMVTETGTIKVADLGISHIVRELSHRPGDPDARGNAYFVSPKQAGGAANLDFRTDIYALGAILYNALTGDVPFGHMEREDARKAHIQSQLPDPRGIEDSIPTQLVMMIEKMLARSSRIALKAGIRSSIASWLSGRINASILLLWPLH